VTSCEKFVILGVVLSQMCHNNFIPVLEGYEAIDAF